MRPRTLLVLAAVVAALAAWVFFHERELPSSDERRRLARRVFRLEPDRARDILGGNLEGLPEV